QNLECEARLHEEIDEVLGGRLPNFDDVPRLRYSEKIMAESMRLYPPAWAVSRLTKAGYDLAGWHLPRGAVCLMSPWVTHRDARFFPDPERFDPERWTPEARESRPKFCYFPFGGGARVCIGERFAWTEGILAMATIAQKWRFRLAAGQVVEPLPLVTLRTKYGMRMIAERRGAAARAAS
ncbi:MAG TPA: cytochrome P450, partial [Bryobacteraceae bacterium]|nr:cytochrome P450 [Bryobacteraceae bacterium]